MNATGAAPALGWRSNLATIAALGARAKNEIVRVPAAAIPGVLAPTIFFLGINGVFGQLTNLTGFSAGSYAAFTVPVSMLHGAGFPGVDGLLVAYAMVVLMAAFAACWGAMLALRFKSQSAAPLMQAGMLALVFLTPAYAPLVLLQGWLHDVAQVNPMTHVIEAARQGFLGAVSWADTWPGLVAASGLFVLVGALALREMRRTGV